MSLTRRFVEQRIRRTRESEAKKAELRQMLVATNILAGHGSSEQRVEAMRSARGEAAERRELFADYAYVRGEQEKERRTRVALAEEKVADELARRHAETARQEMDKRRICDGSEELRTLKERLHAAQVNKERAQQVLEKEVRKEKDRQMEHKIAANNENERLEACELEMKLQLEKGKQRERAKQINLGQMALKEQQREEAYAEYIEEQGHIRDIVEKLNQEDEREASARARKREESREMLKQFMVEQTARQAAAEAEELAENRRIEKHAADKRAWEMKLARDKAQIAKEKEDVLKAMIGKQEAKDREAAELEQLRNDLHQEEHEAVNRRKEEMEQRKKIEFKEEMRRTYLTQRELVEQRSEERRLEEEKTRAELMRKFAEDDRIEQLNDQKRRMKIQEHKREANRLMQLRKEMYDQARDEERREQDNMQDDEVQRQVIVEAERQKLLREHASQLRNFLPKGTLEHADDIKLLFPEHLGEPVVAVAAA